MNHSFAFFRPQLGGTKTARFYLRRSVALLGFSLWALATQAADYPSQTIKVVVPFPAGGSTDLVTRALAVELAAALKQNVLARACLVLESR